MLFTLATISLTGSAVTAYQVEIVATTLYYIYIDDLGRILLVSDELPHATSRRTFYIARVENKFRLRIVPAFENRDDIPYKADIAIARVRDIYQIVYISNISNATSIRIMEKLIWKKLHKLNHVPFNENNAPSKTTTDKDQENEDYNEATVKYDEITINEDTTTTEQIIPLF